MICIVVLLIEITVWKAVSYTHLKVATLSKADLQKIAETKMPDLNAASLEAAMSMIAGTARSMGVKVEE